MTPVKTCCRLHLSTCILSRHGDYYSPQADLVLEQVCEELYSLRPSRLPSQGLTGSQESGLSSRVAPVYLSTAFHQQADQTELTRGCCTDEGAAVRRRFPHSLEVGQGRKVRLYFHLETFTHNPDSLKQPATFLENLVQ